MDTLSHKLQLPMLQRDLVPRPVVRPVYHKH